MSSESENVPESTQENQTEPASEIDQAPQEETKPRIEISAKEQRYLKEKLTRFTSCGRCSLFLAAYRLNHDDAELLAAANNIENGWLSLPWHPGLRKLLNKSYGCRIDVEAYYFESCCPECHGTFVYAESEDDEPYNLQIKM
jgi:hypothetical protein